MAIILGKWEAARPLFATGARPRIAGISGGRTSAMMAALLDDKALLSFQNTGREAKRTYEFLDELAEGLGRPLTWLEYRPPATKGGRPCEAQFAIVDSKTADRSGGPFETMLEAINAFRETKGKGKIAPWVRSRICTVYLKTRTQRKWIASLGIEEFDECVGLRADEPSRVAKLSVGTPKYIHRLAPLDEAGVVKADVNELWSWQTFDLGLPELMGNCTGCFLKDQSDLSRALARPETDVQWWVRMEQTYPSFGGVNFAGYARLASEAGAREAIEAALRDGKTVTPEDLKAAGLLGSMDERRFKLVVIQERKRLAGQVPAFSCSCEGSNTMANMDDEEEDAYIESLPSEDE